MLFRLQPILYSLIFAALLEVVVLREIYFFKIALFLVLFSILVVWPLAKKLRFLAIPFFLSLGSLNLLYLIDSVAECHIFIGISALVYYLALLGAYRLKFYDCDQTAQGMINLATISTIFFWYVANYGWFLNFQISVWILVVTFIGSTFLISLPSFQICAAAQMKKKRENQDYCKKEDFQLLEGKQKIPVHLLINNWVIIFLNVILSLLMAQVIWGLALWPFGYLTTGVVALIIYFILWDIIRNFVQGTLLPKAMVLNLFLAILSIAALLLTAQWEMAV